MTADGWRQISAIYNAAVLRTGADRVAYVSQACGADEGLRRDVESLLGQDESFLATPIALQRGSRLGSYELLSVIGAGGMGVVYRARDTRLQRDVALKLLPEAFAVDADRVARFQREAQILASLNHQHIAAIYGLEESEGVQALVLEFVEGPTLADRITQGPIPLDEALTIARQIAEALEAAHEQGIIHRDLKPANIKVRPDGTVKVLDFGLAKLAQSQATCGDADGTASPTITSPAMISSVGVILGTAAYMSPEQAKGREADKRSDIWAFGCVLYETLTGRRPFDGEDVTDVMVAVLSKEPSWAMLPTKTPPAVRTLLRQCLEKDRKRRLRDIGDAGIAIDEVHAAPDAEVAPRLTPRRGRLAWMTAAVLFLSTLTAWVALRPVPAPPIQSFSILPPNEASIDTIAVSPDGRFLAFNATSAGKVMLWIRSLASAAASPLASTEGANNMFWSPDSQWVGFSAGNELKRIAVSGGPVQTLASGPSGPFGATWNRDGVILFVPGPFAPVYRLSAPGIPPTRVTAFDPSKGESAHRFPTFLPDGHHFIYGAVGSDSNWIKVGTIDSSETIPLVQVDPSDAKAEYLTTAAGDHYLLFVRQRKLLAQRFDPDKLAITGDPTAVTDELVFERSAGGNQRSATLSVSATGIVAYLSTFGLGQRQLVWVDRAGKLVARVGAPGLFEHVELSPDGKRVAVDRVDEQSNKRDVWLTDFDTQTPTRFTFDPDQYSVARWSADGKRLVFPRVGNRKGLYQKLSTGAGAEEQILPSPHDGLLIADDVSANGRFIVLVEYPPGLLSRLSLLPTSGDRRPVPVPNSDVAGANGRFSPDGRWLAYSSGESGRTEVYVQPLPASGAKWQISRDGGGRPRWRRDGKELYFVAADTMLMAAPIAAGKDFHSGVPAPIFPLGYVGSLVAQYPYDVSADGQRFLVIVPDHDQQMTPVTLLLNWRAPLP